MKNHWLSKNSKSLDLIKDAEVIYTAKKCKAQVTGTYYGTVFFEPIRPESATVETLPKPSNLSVSNTHQKVAEAFSLTRLMTFFEEFRGESEVINKALEIKFKSFSKLPNLKSYIVNNIKKYKQYEEFYAMTEALLNINKEHIGFISLSFDLNVNKHRILFAKGDACWI